MEINLFGQATLSDATEFMFSQIDNSDYDIEHIIIVPDRFSLLAEKKLLEILPNGILFNVKVTTFTNFARYILESKKLNADVLSAGERLLNVSKAVSNVKNQFLYFKKSNINFCDKMMKTLSLLQSSNVSYQDLEENEKVSKALKNKLHDIALIYKEYLSLLEGKLDPATLLDFAFSQSETKELLKNKIIYLAQFDSFTAQMYNSIKFFAKNCKKLNISFAKSLSFGNDYIYEKDVEEKIKKFAEEIDCQINVKIGNNTNSENKNNILNSLYSSERKVFTNNNFYQSYSAFSKRQEIQSIASIIADKIRKGEKFKDFEIAVGGLENYQNLIEEIFENFKFSFFIDSSLSANNSVFSRCVFQILEVFNSSCSKESLLNLFFNPLIKLWISSQEIIDKILMYDINGRWKFEKFFDFDDEISSFIKKLFKLQNNEEKFILFNEFIVKLETYHQIYIEKLNENNFFKEKNIENQIFEIVKDAFLLIFKNEDAKESCNLKEFSKQLELILQSKTVSTVPTLVDGILIGDATESFFEHRKYLFVIGGQNLPKVIGDNSLLTDNDIKNPFYKKVVEPTSKMINRRNRFSLFDLVSNAKQNLFVSFLQFDEEGKINSTPLFVEQLNEIFNCETIKFGNIFVINGKENKNEMIFKIACQDNLKNVFCENDQSKTLNDYFIIAKKENFSQDYINKLMFKNNKISVSQLESYFSCPFKHYARYGLKLTEKEEYKFDQRDTGKVCHKAVELFVGDFIKGKIELSYGIVDRFISQYFDKILIEENVMRKLEILPEKDGLINFLKLQVKTILTNVVIEMEKSYYKPKFVEYNIEDNSLFNGEVLFNGKVDRVDLSGDYFRIIDYKTGTVHSLVKDLYYGDKLQLFFYASIIEKQTKFSCGGVFYFNCKFEYEELEKGKSLLKGLAENDDENLKLFDKDLPINIKSSILQLALSTAKVKKKNYTGRVIAKNSMRFYQKYAEKIAQNAFEEIKTGYIYPKPDNNSCAMCNYSSLCLYKNCFGLRIKDFSENVFKEKKDGVD